MKKEASQLGGAEKDREAKGAVRFAIRLRRQSRVPQLRMTRAKKWVLSHEYGLSLISLSDAERFQAQQLIAAASRRVTHIAFLEGFLNFLTLPIVLTGIVVPALIYSSSWETDSDSGGILLVYVSCMLIGVSLFFLPSYLSLKLPFSRRSIARKPSVFLDEDPPDVFGIWYMCSMATICAVSLAVLFGRAGVGGGSWLTNGLIAGLTGILFLVTLVMIVLLTAVFLRNKLEQTWLIRAPHSLSLSGIVLTIGYLNQDWEPLDGRGKAISALEESAKALEYGVPARLRFNNASLDSWFQGEMARRAQAIRELAKVVSLAGKNSPPDITESCTKAIQAIVRDNWLELSAIDVPSPQMVKPHGSWARRGRQILTALIPGLIIFGAEQVFVIESHALSYLWTGAAVWAFVNVILALDPNAREKLTTTREFADTLQNSDPDKKSK